MRIGIDVHVLNGPAQGTTSVWQNLLAALPPGHEYVLYSFGPDQTRLRFPQKQFLHRRIPIRQSHVRIQGVYPFLAWRDHCDVFHTNYYAPLLGVRGLVLTIHDLLYLDYPGFAPSARRWQFQVLVRGAARAAAQIITVSQYSKARIVHHFGVSPDKVAVIYTGLAPAWLEPDPHSIAAAWNRIRGQLPQRYMLTVGRWDPRKNFLMAARVTQRLRRAGLTDALVILGPNDFGTTAVMTQLHQENLAQHVIRIADLETDELQAVYRHAQCLLYLSLAEGFGLPLVEAMATGLPIVASNRTAIPEICQNAALIVDPTDEGEAFAAAYSILERTAVRDQVIAQGLLRSRSFLAGEMARQTMAVYQRAALPRSSARISRWTRA
jgi:glycosyltransferase involved in cell wall biosynthesis